MSDRDALHWWSATGLAAAIAARDLSAAEVMRAHLARIEQVNADVRAIVSQVPDSTALAMAEDADHTVARGDRLGPLHGLPTTHGSRAHPHAAPASHDCVLAERLRGSGALVIGKTNTPEHGLGTLTFNPVFGTTALPWDLARNAGGSSGGAAAGVAAGMLPVADGSDSGGSLRYPAAFLRRGGTAAVHLAARTALVAAGAVVIDLEPNYHGVDEAWETIEMFEFFMGGRAALAAGAEGFRPDYLRNIEQGRQLTAGQIATAYERRTELFRETARLLTEVDALVTPAAPVVAPPIDVEWVEAGCGHGVRPVLPLAAHREPGDPHGPSGARDARRPDLHRPAGRVAGRRQAASRRGAVGPGRRDRGRARPHEPAAVRPAGLIHHDDPGRDHDSTVHHT